MINATESRSTSSLILRRILAAGVNAYRIETRSRCRDRYCILGTASPRSANEHSGSGLFDHLNWRHRRNDIALLELPVSKSVECPLLRVAWRERIIYRFKIRQLNERHRL